MCVYICNVGLKQKEHPLKGGVSYSIQLFWEKQKAASALLETFCCRNRGVKLWALPHSLLIQEKFCCLWSFSNPNLSSFVLYCMTVKICWWKEAEHLQQNNSKPVFLYPEEARLLVRLLFCLTWHFCQIKRLITKCNQTKVLTHNPSVQVCDAAGSEMNSRACC